MKYLKRYNESKSTETPNLLDDIYSDLKDLGAEGRTEMYWVTKSYNPRETWGNTISRIEFAGAIRLYWSKFNIPYKSDDFQFIINLMTELSDIKSKLKSLTDDIYIDWSSGKYKDDDDEENDKFIEVDIRLKKHDEVSTKDPTQQLLQMIKPFCDKNGYKISQVNKEGWIDIEIAEEPTNRNLDTVDEKVKLARSVYATIEKIINGIIKITPYDHPEAYGRFFNLKTLRIDIEK